MAGNVLGAELEPCGMDPKTGFFRDGFCHTCAEDSGRHTICALMDEVFLEFSKSKGNDLSTPRPEFGFPGLKPGDYWCVCMERWIEAMEAGVAPKVRLESTHVQVVEYIDLDVLMQHAVKTPS